MIRGTAIHEHLENWWNTGLLPNAGEYQPWIDSFVNYPNLEKWRALAVELALADRKHDIAGTLDLIVKHVTSGRIALCDYKTKDKEFKKGNHRKQMGGYLSLLQENFPGFHVDTVRIFWISPDETTTSEYDPLDCLEQYNKARNHYFSKQLPF